MELLLFSVLFIFMLGVTLFAHLMDKKHNLQLVRWLSCEVYSPFKENPKQSSTNAEQQIADLKERVATLEKLVTEPAWELNSQINKL